MVVPVISFAFLLISIGPVSPITRVSAVDGDARSLTSRRFTSFVPSNTLVH